MQSILKDQEEIKSIIIEWNEIRKKLLNLIVITDESQLSSKIGQILELMSLLKLMFDRYNEIYPHLVESIANSKYSREKIEYHNLLEKVDEILKQKKYLEQDYQLIQETFNFIETSSINQFQIFFFQSNPFLGQII